MKLAYICIIVYNIAQIVKDTKYYNYITKQKHEQNKLKP